jgi:two-component system, chemotaxis family, sensor kinase CheA
MSKLNLLADFVVETKENINLMTQELSLLEDNPANKELLNSIYRTVHTLKSSANLVNLGTVQSTAHSLENLLDLCRDDKLKLTPPIMSLLIDFCDEMISFLNEKDMFAPSHESRWKELRINILGVLESHLSKSTLLDQKLLFDEKPSLKKKMVVSTEAPRSAPQVKPVAETVAVEFDEKLIEQLAKEPSLEISRSLGDTSVRVNVNLLDKIMNKVGELVLNRNQILQYSNMINDPVILRLTQELNIITTELQTDIMTTRMQPVGNVISKFDRLVRDFCRDTNKKIRLKVIGQETELDKTLIETIKDPLTHILRNAMDHGLELPEERVRAGKNEEGNLVIKAFHESGHVTIEISDDGKGLDTKRIINKALEKKLISEEKAKSLSEDQIFSLIFLPGFSTAEKVTKVSGRGVGMDVVKTNIDKIGGSIQIKSQPSAGTTFRLKIPLTLAIIPALTVKSDQSIFAIPQINIVELVRVNQEDPSQVERIQESEFVRLRGDLIPVFRVHQVLKLPSKEMAIEDQFLNIVILNAEGCIFGLVVDNIMDTQEIVVKPLDRKLRSSNFFAGATIMGDGHVALIIDALGFYRQVSSRPLEQLALDASERSRSDLRNVTELQENLLFTLEDERSYCLPLSLIHRLEEIPSNKIEKVGDQLIFRYGDKPLILINLSDFFKIKLKDDSKTKHQICIVVSYRDQLYGILVNEIVDISITDSNVDTDISDREGFLGTIFINDKLFTLIDVHSVIDRIRPRNQHSEKLINFKNLKKSVLVVEDSPLYRKMEVDVLGAAGLTVYEAKNGDEGLKVLREKKEKIDLIITDIEMPIMNGYEFAKGVRADAEFKHLPIVAISTKVDKKNRDEGVKAGFSLHLEKFKKEELLDAVKTFIGSEE